MLACPRRVEPWFATSALPLLLLACGLRLDDGAGAGAMGSPDQGTAQSQPGSSTTSPPPPEASLGPGSISGFGLRGSAEYSLVDSRFLQCGFREQWSVQFEGLAFERLQEQVLGEECELSGCLFAIEGTGDLSARGRYGQERAYPRELTVTRVARLERVARVADIAALNDLSCPR